MIEISPLPAFDDNYIWCLRHGPAVAVVDPGEAEPVLELLAATGLELAAILVTHHHYDHVGGIGELTARHPVPVYGPAHEAIKGVTHPLGDGDVVELPELGARFTVLELPGHTRGHLAYHGHGALFCGDTLFTAGCGRLFEGSAEQMQSSLARLRTLPGETLVYCAHEYTLANLAFARVVEPESPALAARLSADRARRERGEATVPAPLTLERETNPFLRYDLPQVVAAAEGFAGRPLPGDAEVFATLRHWKDTLD